MNEANQNKSINQSIKFLEIMKSIILIFVLRISSLTFAQEVEFNKKTNVVSINGVESFIIEDANFDSESIVKDLSGKKLAIFAADSYSDPSEVTSGNPQGIVTFMSVVFLTETIDKCEVPSEGIGLRKNLAKHLVENEIIKDGQLNPDAIKRYVAIYGSEYSDRRKSINGIIIIKN